MAKIKGKKHTKAERKQQEDYNAYVLKLREWYAGLAMQSLITKMNRSAAQLGILYDKDESHLNDVTSAAIAHADSMLKRLGYYNESHEEPTPKD